MNRRKNKTLKLITWFAGFGAVLSACCLDSECKVPMIICGICLAWLLLMYAANHDQFEGM
jgi:hypothetical protein